MLPFLAQYRTAQLLFVVILQASVTRKFGDASKARALHVFGIGWPGTQNYAAVIIFKTVHHLGK